MSSRMKVAAPSEIISPPVSTPLGMSLHLLTYGGSSNIILSMSMRSKNIVLQMDAGGP